MSLIATGTPSIAPVPEGTYMARCVQIIDLGTHYSKMYKNESRKVMIRWELPGETYTDQDGNESPRLVHATYTMSLGDKANLRKMLEGWRSKKFTEEELQGFDLSVLIGLPCMVTITHSQGNNGNTYANVSAVAALLKDMQAPAQVNESIVFDLDNPAHEPLFDILPDFIQKMIMDSNEKDETKCKPLPGEVDDGGFPSDDEDLPF